MRTLALTITAAAFAALSAPPASATTLSDLFTSFWAFGDSLSDDGKAPFLNPPSDDGRFSNGTIWTEYLSADFAAAGLASGNFALGGANGAGADPASLDPAIQLSNFNGQISAFDATLPADPFRSLATGDNPLVSVWFGANDLFDFIGGRTTVTATEAADAIADGIRRLASFGTQFNDFLVPNLPDLGRLPSYTTLIGDPDGSGPLAGLASSLTEMFNARLASNMADLEREGLRIYDLDIYSLFNNVLDGVTDGNLGVFAGMNLATPCTLTLDPREGPFPVCLDPDAFFFTDAVHPNRIVHEVIAAEARAAVVPLPGTLPLLGGALLIAGWAGRRRLAA